MASVSQSSSVACRLLSLDLDRLSETIVRGASKREREREARRVLGASLGGPQSRGGDDALAAPPFSPLSPFGVAPRLPSSVASPEARFDTATMRAVLLDMDAAAATAAGSGSAQSAAGSGSASAPARSAAAYEPSPSPDDEAPTEPPSPIIGSAGRRSAQQLLQAGGRTAEGTPRTVVALDASLANAADRTMGPSAPPSARVASPQPASSQQALRALAQPLHRAVQALAEAFARERLRAEALEGSLSARGGAQDDLQAPQPLALSNPQAIALTQALAAVQGLAQRFEAASASALAVSAAASAASPAPELALVPAPDGIAPAPALRQEAMARPAPSLSVGGPTLSLLQVPAAARLTAVLFAPSLSARQSHAGAPIAAPHAPPALNGGPSGGSPSPSAKLMGSQSPMFSQLSPRLPLSRAASSSSSDSTRPNFATSAATAFAPTQLVVDAPASASSFGKSLLGKVAAPVAESVFESSPSPAIASAEVPAPAVVPVSVPAPARSPAPAPAPKPAPALSPALTPALSPALALAPVPAPTSAPAPAPAPMPTPVSMSYPMPAPVPAPSSEPPPASEPTNSAWVDAVVGAIRGTLGAATLPSDSRSSNDSAAEGADADEGDDKSNYDGDYGDDNDDDNDNDDDDDDDNDDDDEEEEEEADKKDNNGGGNDGGCESAKAMLPLSEASPLKVEVESAAASPLDRPESASAPKPASPPPAPVASSPHMSIAQAAAAAVAEEESSRAALVTRVVLSLLTGVALVKHGRQGWPKKRLVWVDVTGNELQMRWGKIEDGFDVPPSAARRCVISLGAISAVESGRITAPLRRTGADASAAKYFSIICPHRSLDWECGDQAERDAMVEGLRRLITEPGLLQKEMMALYRSGEWVPHQLPS